jgi:alpha-glucosidase
MRRIEILTIDAFPDRVLIGEIYLPVQQLMTYYGDGLKGAHLPFNFQLLQCAWTAEAVARAVYEYQSSLPAGAWPNWVLGNHDNARIATRVGVQQAPIAAMLLLTLPGTLTIYYGEEIGMTNVPISQEEVRDPAEKNEPGIGAGRDPERTPIPWDGTPLAGFTTGRPWLPLGADHAVLNVAALEHDDGSLLHLYRELIALRRRCPTLVTGTLPAIAAEGSILRYERSGSGKRLLILLNLGDDPAHTSTDSGVVIASTCRCRDGEKVTGMVELKGAQGLVIDISR